VTVERESHPLKQLLQIFSTQEGIQILESDVQPQNVTDGIHKSFEPDSNVTVERDAFPWKQSSPIFSTGEGIQIVESDEQPKNT
jgi:hypothetical protein